MYARRTRRITFRLTWDDAKRFEALIGRVFGCSNWTDLVERALRTFWQTNGAPEPRSTYTPEKLFVPALNVASDQQGALIRTVDAQLCAEGVDLSDNPRGSRKSRPAAIAATSTAAKKTRPARRRSMAATSSPARASAPAKVRTKRAKR